MHFSFILSSLYKYKDFLCLLIKMGTYLGTYASELNDENNTNTNKDLINGSFDKSLQSLLT